MRLFLRLALLGVGAAIVSSMFLACDSDNGGPPASAGFDAGNSSFDSAAPPGEVDAATDAADASVTPDGAAAVFADVTKDFSVAANPNGAWTYGYALDPMAGPLVVFTTVQNANPEVPSWYDPNNVSLGAPAAFRNDSAAPLSTNVAVGEFAMHPGQAGEYAIARWTVPTTGNYAVSVQWKTGDTGDTDGLLLKNGVAIVTEPTTSAETVHDMMVTLAAGDHLDVAVGAKGDYTFDTTPVHLTIRTAP